MSRRIKVLSISGGAMGALLLVASAAFACVQLATLSVTPGKGDPGMTVSARVLNVQNAAGVSDVNLHWGGVDGPVVATAEIGSSAFTSSGRAFTADLAFTVPEAAPGTYVIVATQYDAAGAPIWGMPARSTFVVSGVAVSTAVPTEAAAVPETVVVEQKYVVQGETPEATQAPAARHHVAAPAQAAPAQVAPAQAAPAAPEAAPAAPLSLEARDAITETVAPAGAREVSYVPAASRAESSSNVSLRLGIALAIVGSMALITAAGAAYILRPARAGSSR